MSKIEAAPDGLRVYTSYNAAFVTELKYIVPSSKRSFTKTPQPCWIVDPTYGDDIARLIKQFFGEDIAVPSAALATRPTFNILRIEYIGRCKDGLASGYCDGAWSVKLPEPLLRTWFCDELPSGDIEILGIKSLYTDLGIKNFSDAEHIKLAYRRMAKQWHPDVCREQDAKTRFQAINHAYEILKDQRLRAKYDCGLIFQERAEQPVQRRSRFTEGYRTPLRCGLIAGMGTLKLGQVWLDSILKWDDIIDSTGRTMIASWPTNADTFQIDWS